MHPEITPSACPLCDGESWNEAWHYNGLILAVDWRCPACLAEWETQERPGAPKTRRTVWIRPCQPEPNSFGALLEPLHPNCRSALAPPSPPSGASPTRPQPELIRSQNKLIGYRGWTLDGYKLGSANRRQHGGYWTIGPNKAECRKTARATFLANGDAAAVPSDSEHDAPHPDCECGLYAYFDIHRENNPHNLKPDVWGAVVAWGRVEVHQSGFRAEYAEPVAFGYSPRDAYEDVRRIEAVAGELGLPFVTFDELEAEALKHGQLVTEEMRPVPPLIAPPRQPGGYLTLSEVTAQLARQYEEYSSKLFESIEPQVRIEAERESKAHREALRRWLTN